MTDHHGQIIFPAMIVRRLVLINAVISCLLIYDAINGMDDDNFANAL